jgi:uncharacterized protein
VALPPHLTIVTLGVEDLERSIGFYRALGWESRGEVPGEICWFRTSGTWLGLFGRDALAEDVGVPAGGEGFRGVTLAINVGTDAEVEEGLAAAAAAGGSIVKPATRADWGGYSGYFADPDGHLWEVAHADFPLSEGRIEIG